MLKNMQGVILNGTALNLPHMAILEIFVGVRKYVKRWGALVWGKKCASYAPGDNFDFNSATRVWYSILKASHALTIDIWSHVWFISWTTGQNVQKLQILAIFDS